MAIQSSQQQPTQQQPSSSSSSSVINKPQFRGIEEYRKALEEFAAPKDEDCPITSEAGFTRSKDPLVDEYFQLVAHTGRPHLPWQLIRPAFLWKLQTVMNDMHVMDAEKQNDDHQKEAIINSEEIKEAKQFVADKAQEFDGTPFTIQRLCELLTEPIKQYHSAGVFLRALEKNINVVTTITEQGIRITGVDEEIGAKGDEDGPIPVERNFIVSVDEVDEPLPHKMAKQSEDATKMTRGNELEEQQKLGQTSERMEEEEEGKGEEAEKGGEERGMEQEGEGGDAKEGQGQADGEGNGTEKKEGEEGMDGEQGPDGQK